MHVAQETLKVQKEAEGRQREIAALKQEVELAEGEREQGEAVYTRIEELKRQLAAETASGHSITTLRAQIVASQTEHTAFQKKRDRLAHDLESLATHLQVSDSSKARLEGKTSELQRLVDDVAARRSTMRRVELLRNLQIIWSRRVFLRLTRFLTRWQSAIS